MKPILRVLIPIAASVVAASAPAKDRQFDPTTYTWNPELSPRGPVLVTVSLKSQVAAVFRNGVKIGECQVSSGKPGHETPTGVFHILNKDADHRSKTYGNAPMPFSERLTWDGVALHAGALPGYPSSHGCIHLPYEFSRKLFGITHNGTTVVVTDEHPQVHVSDRHRVAFQAGEEVEFIWKPQASPDGPVSLVYSGADQRLYLLRNGVTIGECPAKTAWFSKKPKGTTAFLFAGWQGAGDAAESSWIQVGGAKTNHTSPLSEWFKVDPRFQYLVHGMITPGTNLILTEEPVTAQTRTSHGFRVMAGPQEESALQQGN